MKFPIYPDRVTEWVTSSIMVMAFAQLFFLTGTDNAEGYSIFESIGIHRDIPIIALGIIGFARIVALFINGSWKRTPMIRAVGAITGAFFFTLLTLGGYLPAVILAVADYYAGYKAGRDARYVTTR